ncbi:MAG: ArsR family transcriptional regulator [Candidatus Margulisbacteria bacterium]|jgi:DNA-binding transcriptional ArsR family regulator|nr:ArsR family transcriptional regulator [Candidatus Margulisiibacteriota bacterium]
MKMQEMAVIFDALSKTVRLKVFCILLKHHEKGTGGVTPTQIAKEMGNIPRNTLSFHLSLLGSAGLCHSRRRGKTILYVPDCKHIKAVAAFLVKDCCKGECKW